VEFDCSNCSKITSLEGCPKEVGSAFWAIKCGKRFTKDDVKKYCKIKWQ
jgi:hypothetical protein